MLSSLLLPTKQLCTRVGQTQCHGQNQKHAQPDDVVPGEDVHTTQFTGKFVQLMFGFNAKKASCVRPAFVQMR